MVDFPLPPFAAAAAARVAAPVSASAGRRTIAIAPPLVAVVVLAFASICLADGAASDAPPRRDDAPSAAREVADDKPDPASDAASEAETKPTSDEDPADEPDPAALAERIDRALALLDDDSFHKREAATNFLADAGSAAVEPVMHAALRGSAEASWRAVEILRRLAITRDMATERAAERALVTLQSSDRRSVADRARAVREKLQADRHERAVEMLSKLGAEINPNIGSIKLDGRWKGGDDGLVYLAWVRDFTSISIEAPAGVTEEAVERLRASVSDDVQVAFFGKALLGIRGIKSTYIPGVIVHEVVPTSGAGKAGLQERDIITRFDGKDVTDFNQLVDAIRKKRVGDVVEIKVKRLVGAGVTGDYQTVELKAKLTARSESVP